MKKNLFLLPLLGLFSLAILFSCNKKDDEEAVVTPSGAASGTIQGTVDGTVINTTTQSSMCTGGGGNRVVAGNDATGNNSIWLSFKFATGSEAGTYTLHTDTTTNLTAGEFTATFTPVFGGDGYATLNSTASTGTLTVSSFSTSGISGSFSFTGYNDAGTVSKSITSGTFNNVKVY